ncbi:hypothetical protein QYF36_013037 [Acer negundo]|nr:hypothetical protein QYF36_013037 [Acer negundo]
MRIMALSIGTLIQCFDLEEARCESQGPLKTNMNKPEKIRSLEIVFRPRQALNEVLQSFWRAKALMNMQKLGFLLEVEHASDGSKSRADPEELRRLCNRNLGSFCAYGSGSKSSIRELTRFNLIALKLN